MKYKYKELSSQRRNTMKNILNRQTRKNALHSVFTGFPNYPEGELGICTSWHAVVNTVSSFEQTRLQICNTKAELGVTYDKEKLNLKLVETT